MFSWQMERRHADDFQLMLCKAVHAELGEVRTPGPVWAGIAMPLSSSDRTTVSLELDFISHSELGEFLESAILAHLLDRLANFTVASLQPVSTAIISLTRVFPSEPG
jgi:hypothetical protein